MPNPPALRPHAGNTSLNKPDLGTKRVCPSCAARFYDLQKRPIECPKCAFAFEPEMLLKQRRTRVPEPVKPVVAAEAEDEEVEETEDEEVEEAVTEAEEEEDDSLFEEVEEDEDDVSGIIDADIEKDEP